MLYGRFGDEIELVRLATLDDVRTYDRREPDAQDVTMVQSGSYVVTRSKDTSMPGFETVAHLSYLRADGGIAELMDAIDALPKP